MKTLPTSKELRPNNSALSRIGLQKIHGVSASSVKWGWSVRELDHAGPCLLEVAACSRPQSADVVVAQIAHVGNHARIYTVDRKFSRLYEGDVIVGVIGYRYATSKFHAPSIDIERLHLLTNAGLCGTVRERHASTKAPTNLQVLGLLADGKGAPVNLRKRLFRPRSVSLANRKPVVLAVGSSMDSGKTTVVARTGQSLAAADRRVALLKLTGSVTNRDLDEFRSTGAVFVRDFSDYGFPSTYLLDEQTLLDLFQTMIFPPPNSGPTGSDTQLERSPDILPPFLRLI